MTVSTQLIRFEGALLQRGFWLYVWEIKPFDGSVFCYVGRTGDSSSHNAQSPFNRMSQHLGFNPQRSPKSGHVRSPENRP